MREKNDLRGPLGALSLLLTVLLWPGCSALTDLDSLRGTGAKDAAALEAGADAAPDDGPKPPDKATPLDKALADKAIALDKATPLDKAKPLDKATPLDLPVQPDQKPPVDMAIPVDTGTGPTTYVVSTAGKDSSSCGTPADPCASVYEAMGKANLGDTVLVKNGTYFPTTQSYPIYLKKGVTLKGEGGSTKVTLKGQSPLIKCGAVAGQDSAGAKVVGLTLQATTGSEAVVICKDIKGTPDFVGVTMAGRGIVLDKATATFDGGGCQGISAGSSCMTIDNSVGKVPYVRNFLFSGGTNSICLQVGLLGKVDLGTFSSGGKNKFAACTWMYICNNTGADIQAYGNSWNSAKMTQGTDCKGTTPFGNIKGGTVKHQ